MNSIGRDKATDWTDLTPLKLGTRRLVASSRKPERAGEEGDSDLIDWTIIDAVETIDRNPHLAITGSCSGHDGFPFVTVVFGEPKVRDYYLGQIRREGFQAELSDAIRMEFFDRNFRKVKITEEWAIGPAEDREYTIEESKQFWEEWQRVLTTLPP